MDAYKPTKCDPAHLIPYYRSRFLVNFHTLESTDLRLSYSECSDCLILFILLIYRPRVESLDACLLRWVKMLAFICVVTPDIEYICVKFYELVYLCTWMWIRAIRGIVIMWQIYKSMKHQCLSNPFNFRVDACMLSFWWIDNLNLSTN